VAGKKNERDRKTHLINRWLRDWCQQWNFAFFDHEEVYCWQQMEICRLKVGKEFLLMSWWGSLRGL